MKKEITKIFIDEIYSSTPKKKQSTNEIMYNHIDETCRIDLADFSDYKKSINKGFMYIIIIIDNFKKNFEGYTFEKKCG